MPAFPRDELEEMMRRWVAANDEAGETGDWSKMSQFYTEDAIYTWNNGDKWEFKASNRQEITTGCSAPRWRGSSTGSIRT